MKLLNSLVNWLRAYQANRPMLPGAVHCDRRLVAEIAGGLGMTAAELEEVIAGAAGADLLLTRVLRSHGLERRPAPVSTQPTPNQRVARPRNAKKPTTSVTVVTKTADATAGSML